MIYFSTKEDLLVNLLSLLVNLFWIIKKNSPFNLREENETVSTAQSYAEKAFFEYLALRLHCGCYVLYTDED